jgi:hypothetical protein
MYARWNRRKVYVEFVINQDGFIDDESVRALTQDELSKVVKTTNVTFDPDCQDEPFAFLEVVLIGYPPPLKIRQLGKEWSYQ